MTDEIICNLLKLKLFIKSDCFYHIPKFQREFSWGPEHVDDFFTDLTDHLKKDDSTDYYFGTLICVEKEKKPEESYWVVDGQQRLTVSMVFLSVVRDKFLDLEENKEADTVNEYIFVDNNKQFLTLSKNNMDLFDKVILKKNRFSEKANQLDPKKVNTREKLLAQCYSKLNVHLDTVLNDYSSTEEKSKYLIKIYNHFLRYFIINRIRISSYPLAYEIFEKINNRGQSLDESDLVKNYLLQLIEHDKLNVDTAYDYWMCILEFLQESKTKEDIFLGDYIRAYFGPVKPEEVYSKIKEITKKGDDSILLINDLLVKAENFNKLKKPDSRYWSANPEIVEDLETFELLTAKVVYPALLIGYDVFKEPKQFSKFVKMILIYYFRTRTICLTEAVELRRVIDELCTKLRDKETTATISSLKKFLQEDKTYPIDDKFRFEFENFVAIQKNALYIMNKLNQQITGNSNMTLNARKGNTQLEHIMPKIIKNSSWYTDLKKLLNANDPKEEDELIKKYHLRCLWRIGNLTLLNNISNPMASNSPIKEKIEIYKDDNSKITSIINNTEWNEENIIKRQKELTQHALKIWTLDSIK